MYNEKTANSKQQTANSKQQTDLCLLIITNIISFIFLLIISFHYQVPHKIIKVLFLKDDISQNQENVLQNNNIRSEPVPAKYSGYIYPKEMIESLVYKRDGFNIVMLGDSLTCHNNWGEILKREDIANYGIGGDTTEAIIKRINDINLVSPSKCFLMVGINDIFGKRSIDEIITNYRLIIKYLKRNNIEIYIQSVLYISDLAIDVWGHNPIEVNNNVNKLNEELEILAKDENLQYININKLMRNGNILNNLFTNGDGVHLNMDGYSVWANELKKYL